jgi:hypothetical protein
LIASLPGVLATRFATYVCEPDSALTVSLSHVCLLGIAAAWVGAAITDSTRAIAIMAPVRSRRSIKNLAFRGPRAPVGARITYGMVTQVNLRD